ncbi:MAG: acylphosphatase [Alphaproteobacteria bacterium]|nr:acylphosphatase [Alphaproteobacteria bacterium]
MAATQACVRVRIRGRVQGVYFRAWTVQRARDLCLDGWVRNRTDGSVEALFSGPGDQVERMIAECHDGPPHAAVEAVEREAADPVEPGAGFRQRATG